MAAVWLLAVPATPAFAVGGRLGLSVVHLDPEGDAEGLGEAGWGAEIEAVATFSGLPRFIAPAMGLMVSELSSSTIIYQPTPLDFRRELTTEQNLVRFYLGVELGPHGHGFLQPFVSAHGGIINHSLTQTLEEPDDVNPLNTRTQEKSESDTGVGYDVSAGLHLKLFRKVGVVAGARYLRSYGLNEPLGEEDAKADPEYIEGFAGVSLDLGWATSSTEEPPENAAPVTP